MDDIMSKAVSLDVDGEGEGETEGESPHYESLVLLQVAPDGKLQATRSQHDRERNPDRITLDRRGLTKVPQLVGECRVRLLSLQHNLITRVDNMAGLGLSRLVFLDLYDNQLERVGGLDALENLRVLLLGKNRIRRVEGLTSLVKLEVLDLHGNQLQQVGGLGAQTELKVLNLAGNQLRSVDLQGLNLQALLELNLRRNRLRSLHGLGHAPLLQKLFLSNNQLRSVDCMSSVAKAANLTELAVDGNPLALAGDCVSFLVSSLPKLRLLGNLEVSEAVRKAARSWRGGREAEAGAGRREEVICNARTNWELLRSQTCGSLQDLRCSEAAGAAADRSVQSDSGISVADDAFGFFKLPPILGGEDSLSSVEPNVDSSLSSLPSSDSSDGGDDDLDSSEDAASPPEATARAEEPRRPARGAAHCRRRGQPRACTARAKQKGGGLPGRVREQGQ